MARRPRTWISGLVVAAVWVAACGGDDAGDDGATSTSRSSSTTTSAISSTSTTTPGVAGGDGGSSAPTGTVPTTLAELPEGRDPAIRLQRVARLDRPIALADPVGPGPVLVATQGGEVRQLDLASGDSRVVLDLGDRISEGGEQGLLGIAVGMGRLFANYTDRSGDTQVRSWPMGADGAPTADGEATHLSIDQPYPNHNGGNLVFGPDGVLWIGTGDGGAGGDPQDRAQDPSTLLGKMLRVMPNPAGGAAGAPANPDWGGRPEIWGIGLRNPWRYSFDRVTHRLWVADVGQGDVEEVSVIDHTATRANFGWDDVEGDRDFEGRAKPEFTAPVITYDHSDGDCSVTGGYVYRGTAVPSLHGWYLFADYCGQWVRAVPSSHPTSRPVELVSDAGPVLSFGELEDGEVLVLSADAVLRVVSR